VTHLLQSIANQMGRFWARALRWPWLMPTCVFLVLWAVYAATGTWHRTPYDAHVYLSNAFLHGHLDIEKPPGHFELVWFNSKAYLNYGIAPAILMMPLTAIWGTQVHQALFCAALGAAAAAIWSVVLRRWPLANADRWWMLAAFALGTPVWFNAGRVGSTWPLMHMSVLFGLSIAFAEVYGRRRGWIVGLGLAIAISSRQLALMTTPFFAYMLARPEANFYVQSTAHVDSPDQALTDLQAESTAASNARAKILELASQWRRLRGFGLVLFTALAVNAGYNFLRFQSLTDNGYARFIAKDHPRFGVFSLGYVPDRIQGYFYNLPQWSDLALFGRHIPWLDCTLDGPNLWLSFPVIFLALVADYRKIPNLLALLAILMGFCPYLFYYWSGWTQFGCRYFLDVMPFAMVLVADGTRRMGTKCLRNAVLMGMLVEVWGITWWAYKGW
jgi:hypothetical protein